MATKTYEVGLNRQDPQAGQVATKRVTVQATDQESAKRQAEAQYPGYKAINVRPK